MRKLTEVEQVIKKEIKSLGAECDRCGKKTIDRSTTGPIDWEGVEASSLYNEELDKYCHRTQTTCCWYMDDVDKTYCKSFEVVLCPDCFMAVLGKYVHEVDHD